MPRKTKRKRNKKKKKTRKLKIKCAPKAKNETLPYTCYTAKGLHKIKNIWNKKHPDRKIKSNRPRNIWRALQYALNKSCNRESCWLKQKFIKEDIDLETKEYTFAPEAPKEWKENPNEWLTSIDILEVMKQYERTYKCFDFIGPSPIDYDKHIAYGECVWEELCEFSLKKQLKDGKTKIGIVFNLDPHHKPGSHWIAMFIHTKKKEIYYLDSYGEKIPRQVKKFAKKVQKQSLKIGDKKEYKLIENKRRHQFSESECGMYSLYFIIQMLKGTTFKKFTSKRIKDNYMMKLRKIYFNQ
tara:strand:+ start:4979 stop:5869 length:891 start_codon:yes stop_codon:yes gene_type:complete